MPALELEFRTPGFHNSHPQTINRHTSPRNGKPPDGHRASSSKREPEYRRAKQSSSPSPTPAQRDNQVGQPAIALPLTRSSSVPLLSRLTPPNRARIGLFILFKRGCNCRYLAKYLAFFPLFAPFILLLGGLLIARLALTLLGHCWMDEWMEGSIEGYFGVVGQTPLSATSRPQKEAMPHLHTNRQSEADDRPGHASQCRQLHCGVKDGCRCREREGRDMEKKATLTLS